MGAGGLFKIAAAHFLRVVSMVVAGGSKATRGWRMVVLESRSARFFNRRPRTRVGILFKRCDSQGYFSSILCKQEKKYGVIAQEEIQMAHSNK